MTCYCYNYSGLVIDENESIEIDRNKLYHLSNLKIRYINRRCLCHKLIHIELKLYSESEDKNVRIYRYFLKTNYTKDSLENPSGISPIQDSAYIRPIKHLDDKLHIHFKVHPCCKNMRGKIVSAQLCFEMREVV